MQIRLNKYLSQAGRASRREADRLIAAGKVRVNGAVVTDLGRTVDDAQDRVEVGGRKISARQEPVTIVLHKPPGCLVTRNDPQGRPTIYDFLPQVKTSIFPVGRLDFESEGLLLLTNDGELAFRLTHPRFQVPKTYLVKAEGEIGGDKVKRLERGIRLEDGKTAPARIRVLTAAAASSLLRIEVREGRKREVRRMLEAVGHRVTMLKRIAFAGLELAPLQRGRWRFLSARETKALKDLVGMKS
ncbi:MAG: rRNA pseudouridine synthase [Candidatus Aminicenantes bacterium]|nr:rRNA pseudouridine synthase [Candidatus Aminicenantes bacterium]